MDESPATTDGDWNPVNTLNSVAPKKRERNSASKPEAKTKASTRKRLKSSKTKVELEYENKELKKDSNHFRRELTSLQKRHVELQKNEQALKDDLLRLRPKQEITDREIGDLYENLRGHVYTWLDGEIYRSEDSWPESHDGGQLEMKRLFHACDPVVSQFIENNPESAGQYLLRQLIMHHIHECLLVGDLLPFGREDDMAFIQKVEHGLAKVDPPRG